MIGERAVVFAGATHQTPVIARDRLPEDYRSSGPMVIEEQSATTVVPPGWAVALDELGSLVLTKEGA